MLVQHPRLPSWPCNCLQDPFFVAYRIAKINRLRIHVRCVPFWVGSCCVHLRS